MRKGIRMTGLKELMEIKSWQGWCGGTHGEEGSGSQDSWHPSPAHILSGSVETLGDKVEEVSRARMLKGSR